MPQGMSKSFHQPAESKICSVLAGKRDVVEVLCVFHEKKAE
jgi:hypothetical protein